MKQVGKQSGIVAVLAFCAALQAAAQSTVELQGLRAARDGSGVRVEITLSGKVKASIETAVQPDRLVIVLPDAIFRETQERIAVNANGVRSVRAALYSVTPPESHVVVDLDRVLPYTVSSEGNKVVIHLGVGTGSEASKSHGAPAAAASGSLIGIFRRRRQDQPADASETPAPAPVQPPPAQPPIAFPGDETEATNRTGNATTSPPTAAHPNRGSLQEGTVFPGFGSPATGSVPPPSGASTGGYPSAAVATGKAAAASEPVRTSATTPASNQTLSGPLTAGSGVSRAELQSLAAARPVTLAPALQVQPNPIVSPQTSAGQAGVAMPEAAKTTPPLTSTPSAGSQQPSGPAVASSEQNVAPDSSVATRSSPAEPAAGDQSPDASAASSGESERNSADEANQTVRKPSDLKTVFHVKYVAQGVAYLDGGRSSGLAEGMKLEVRDADLPATQGAVANPDDPRAVAELEVTAVADTSAVTDIHQPKREVKPGDLAYLSAGDEEALVQQRALSATRKYPAVVTFTEGDPLEEEAHEQVPRPPLPSVNRARGRIGFDYMGTVSRDGSAMTSTDLGLVLRADITRINGTYWNVSGFWRGRLSSNSSNTQATLQDLINRTYHLSLTYDNPNSAWVMGFGRLYLPWATSLDTIDGGYAGRKLSHGATAGVFAGSTPDPTSWDYSPNRRIAGAFINFEGGSYDDFHYTSTSGLGISTLRWQIDRPFVFFENGLSYKRYLSIYDSLQADSPRGNSAVPSPGPGLSRNFLTVRVQPHPRFELDFNHNYFRDIPTFDPQLVGTGLLDKYLFQGFSFGGRVEVIKNVSVYTNLGFSNRSGDAKNSLNQLFGITFMRLPWLGLRADAHYSRFNSPFGDGTYESASLSREVGEGFRVEGLFGQQRFTSALATNDSAKFVTGMVDWSMGAHYFFQGGTTFNRGGVMSYDQWSLTLGYRFDNRSGKQH